MKQRNINSKRAASAMARCSLSALAATFAACSADTLVMGENTSELTPPPPDSRCHESTTLSGDLLVETQDELDSFEGCEHIDGSLSIVFDAIDLRPLHALTSVKSTLRIEGPGEHSIASLEGLESLQTVGNLEIGGLMASDLMPLRNLEFMTIGKLTLKTCPNLVDLDGLAQLKGVRHLWLLCAGLETIAPLTLSEQMADIWFFDSKLTRLTDLGVREISGSLVVMGSELTNLDAFSALESVGGIEVRKNALLENIDATSGLERAGRIVAIENPNLTHLPDYLQLVGLSEVWINDNDRLVTWPQFADLFMGDIGAPMSPFIRRSRTIEIMGNAALTSVELPAAWANGATVAIGDNAALTQVALPTLAYLETLIIDNNPSLTSVEFGGFDRAFALEVRDNPSLDDSIFATVRSLEREIVRNAPQP